MPFSLTINLGPQTLAIIVSILMLLWGGHYWVVRQIFKGTFSTFKLELMKEINGTYLRSKVYEPWQAGINARMNHVETDIRDIRAAESYPRPIILPED